MSKKYYRYICLLIAVSLTLSVSACKKQEVVNTPSGNVQTSSQQPESLENIISDDAAVVPTDEEETYIEEEEFMIYDVNISNTTPINTSFKGINGIYQLYSGLSDRYGRVYTESQRQLEFDRLEDMGIGMVRSFYGSSLAYDPKTGGLDFESEDMLKFYDNCLELQKRGIDIGITAQWSLRNLIEPDLGSSSPSNVSFEAYGVAVEGDFDATMQNYAEFMRQSVLQFKARGINNIKYMFAFTECNNTYGYTTEERQYDKLYPYYDKAITALDQGLKDSGLRNSYKIVAPCDNWRNDYDYSRLVRYTIENLSDKVDIIGSHNAYDRASQYIDDSYYYIPQMNIMPAYDDAKNAGKEFWLDEYNVAVTEQQTPDELRENNSNPWKGTALGAMTASIMNMGVSNVFLWSICDQQWPNNVTGNREFDNGTQIGGYLKSLFESHVPYPAWYSCSLITKYIGEGEVFAGEGGYPGLYASCIKRNDGNWTVIVVNYNFEEMPVKIQFEKSVGGKTFNRYLYEPNKITPTVNAQMIGISAEARDVTTGFYDTIPIGAVAIYTTCK